MWLPCYHALDLGFTLNILGLLAIIGREVLAYSADTHIHVWEYSNIQIFISKQI